MIGHVGVVETEVGSKGLEDGVPVTVFQGCDHVAEGVDGVVDDQVVDLNLLKIVRKVLELGEELEGRVVAVGDIR